MRFRLVVSCVAVFAAVTLTTVPVALAPQNNGQANASTDNALVVQQMAAMPLAFTENRGQWDERVRFRASAGGTTLWFGRDGITYQFTHRVPRLKTADTEPLAVGIAPRAPFDRAERFMPNETEAQVPSEAAADSIETVVIHAAFAGSNPEVELAGENRLEYRCNYFLGNDPAKWQTDVPNYTAVVYRDVYPGVDVRYEGKGGALTCSYTAASESDLAQVKFQYEGFDSAHPEGNAAVTETGLGQFRVEAPWGAVLEPLSSGQADGLAGSAAHVAASTLEANGVTSVTLVYSTYLGGSNSDDGSDIAVDEVGSAYVTGYTKSADFPTQNPYDGTFNGVYDVFVTKLSPTGNALVYSTFLGGSSDDLGFGIAVDQAGSAYVTGYTNSTDFPTQNPYDGSYNGDWDVFVTKLSSAGNALVYSTYLGGWAQDFGYGIAVDSAGSAYVTGVTTSTFFPTQNPYDGSYHGSNDVFVTKLSPAGNALVYSTFLGRSGDDWGNNIAVDQAGSAYVTGMTKSSDFPTQNPYDGSWNGYRDVFVTKLSPTGNALVYSSFLGGSSDDFGGGIAVDQAGSAYVTGMTKSSDFPTQNPYDGSLGGSYDVFLTKLSPAGNALVYSTFLGGSSDDFSGGIAVDQAGSAYVTGYTYSTDFPTQNPYDGTFNGGIYDAFVTKLSPTGNALAYSTYLGGSGYDRGYGIAVDTAGSAYVTGRTYSTDFPTQNAYDGNFNGGDYDVFVTKLSQAPSAHLVETQGDSGPGSLREALVISNASPGVDTIRFAVASSISLLSPLPALTDSSGIVLLGFTAPGASAPFSPTVIVDGSGSTPGPGLELQSSNNRIEGLTFRHFAGPGVAVTGASSIANTITGCQFYGNTGPGIDLGNDGITPNDPGDVDTGPSALLNYPVFDSVLETGVDTFTVFGTTAPNSLVELFLAAEAGNPAHQPETTDHGPAYLLIGQCQVFADGIFSFRGLASIRWPEWSAMTATVTDAQGNTSELSENKPLTPDPLRITAYSEPVPPLRGVMSLPLGSPALQVTVYSPPDSVGHVDSIGSSFNTFGSRATYDSLTDHNSGGLPDTRVKIASPDTGEYQIKYVLIGDPGSYLTGIGIDGHAEVKKQVAFAAMGQVIDTTYHLAPPTRGDLNGDGVIDVFDVIASIDIIFSGAPPPSPPELADVNCDGVPDVFDVIYLIDYAFSGGPAPCQ